MQSMRVALGLLLFWAIQASGLLETNSSDGVAAGEPNPPTWPKNVYVFDPADYASTQTIVDQVFKENGGLNVNGQWSNDRYAFLFKPGWHNIVIKVGFYTSVIGLGISPETPVGNDPPNAAINVIQCPNGDSGGTGATQNFWRSIENVHTDNALQWANSQACPMRRLSVNNDVYLSDTSNGQTGYSSGGFMADSVVSGTIHFGTQQQFFTRNVNSKAWSDNPFNNVFVGCTGGVYGARCASSAPGISVTSSTPIIAEKPYITIDTSNKFYLQVPRLEKNKSGNTPKFNNNDQIDFSNVYVATQADSAATINAKLASGLHLILCAGNYNLQDSINITRANTYVVGIGYPTLIANNGLPAIIVGNVAGVRVAGILFQAGPKATSALLQVGTSVNAGDSSNPTFLYDIFARVGGPNNPNTQQMQATSMVVINSGNVIYDGAWLWRADHDVNGLVKNSNNPVSHGLVVNGANVIAYGLASEHTLQDLVQWNGDNGSVYFYQSELPYDVTQANFGTPGYTGFRVGSGVNTFNGYGIGVYCYFRDYAVTTNSGMISNSSSSNVKFHNALTWFITGQGQITHVVNNVGNAVNGGGQKSYVCSFP